MPACLFSSADYEQSLRRRRLAGAGLIALRSEEHTSELQSP